MFTFDNNHIFTGYIKQLLATFNLPTCKVYTKEFADYFAQFGKEDPRVIESFDNIKYSTNTSSKSKLATRVSYLRGQEVYTYHWPYLQNRQNLNHDNCILKCTSDIHYSPNKNTHGLTRTLNSPGSVYDTITHEYLGDYLRFIRDYYNINLMPLYNCFNNKIYNNIYYSFKIAADQESDIVFNSQDSGYRIYAFPVKLFNDYTIAIDCDREIEMFCGLYKTYLDTSKKGIDLINKTYKKITRSFFSQPFLYDGLNVKNWNFKLDSTIAENELFPNFVNDTVISRWDIALREQDLKLFIKVPVSCKSSITVLEGNYLSFNNSKYHINSRKIWEYKQNHTIINFGDDTDLNTASFTPIGKLQLLAFNTGTSYPFSDRLVEYLSNSAITPIDEIPDNIKRVQRVMEDNRHYFKVNGLWEDKMQKILYDYITSSGPIEVSTSATNESKKLVDCRQGYHKRLGHCSKSTLYDILGYVDRDAEKWYASWKLENGVPTVRNSIQNVDIYNGLFDN